MSVNRLPVSQSSENSRVSPDISNHIDVGPDSEKLAILLVGGLLIYEMATPFLIQHSPIPGSIHVLDNLILTAIAGLLIFRIFVWNTIPQATFLLIAVSVIGVVMASAEGQSIGATLWGLWEFIKFPVVGLLVYLQPTWPQRTLEWLRNGIFALVAIQVVAQIGQWLIGIIPGDNMSGTFGSMGTSRLAIFLCFALCFGFARWLVDGDRRSLIGLGILLLFCGIASALGEMKVFLPIAVLLAGLAMCLKLFIGGKLLQVVPAVLLVSLLIVTSAVVYNRAVAETRGIPKLEEYFSRDTTERYVNAINYDPNIGRYYLGRGKAVSYGWQLIQRDMTTFLFGYGIGARSESQTLGIAGSGVERGLYGTFAGSTGLLIMLQETGIVGISLFIGFITWLCWTLLTSAKKIEDRDFQISAYGMTLFSLAWPLWLWYASVWSFGITMVLYWGAVGLLFRWRSQYRESMSSQGCVVEPMSANDVRQLQLTMTDRWI